MPATFRDLPLLREEFTKLACELGDGYNLATPEDMLKTDALMVELGRADMVLKNAKTFLDICDGFLQPLVGLHPIATSVYGAVKYIITVCQRFWKFWLRIS
jgi:hypothetical protein